MIGIRKFAKRLIKFDLVLIIIMGWEVFARFIFPLFETNAALYFPPPTRILAELWTLLSSGILLGHILSSLRKVLIGGGLAAAAGILIGLGMGISKVLYDQLQVICRLLRPIPPVAWIPISILWFGITDSQQYFIVFISVLFPVIFHTLDAVLSIPAHYIRSARSLGCNGWKLITRITIPAALPKIMFGIRAGFAYAWFIIVAAEFVSSKNGLGYLILEGRNAMITERIFAGMITIGFINIAFYYIFTMIRNRITVWQEHGYTDNSRI